MSHPDNEFEKPQGRAAESGSRGYDALTDDELRALELDEGAIDPSHKRKGAVGGGAGGMMPPMMGGAGGRGGAASTGTTPGVVGGPGFVPGGGTAPAGVGAGGPGGAGFGPGAGNFGGAGGGSSPGLRRCLITPRCANCVRSV